MNNNKQLGMRGEKAALGYLRKNNYQILETNYKSGYNEIDIITKKNEDYIFVEVKTRIKNCESAKESPISVRQINNLKIALMDYAHLKYLKIDSLHLDLIVILANPENGKAELRHYMDII